MERNGKTAEEWYEIGVEHRKNERFGEAMNAFLHAADAASCSAGCGSGETVSKAEEIRKKALASIELLREINGFVNKDLMNP